ncbi:MAG: pirin family protein [Ilumatobacteraceae bacterium]
MTISIQQPSDRFLTDAGWLHSRHSFNFGPHYSPAHTGHGLLLVNNDDVVAPGVGFGTHGHRDMEIVTWVLSGKVAHEDSEGNSGVLYPGLAQRMSAGTGIRHSEVNPDPDVPVHLIQMWVLPDTDGIEPEYEQLDMNDELAKGGLVAIASGKGHEGAISIHQRDAVLWGARLAAGETVTLPDDTHVHAYVALGSATVVTRGDETVEQLAEGAAARLTNAGALEVTAGPDGAELLVWATA